MVKLEKTKSLQSAQVIKVNPEKTTNMAFDTNFWTAAGDVIELDAWVPLTRTN